MFYAQGDLVGLAADVGTTWEGDVWQVWKVKANSYLLRRVHADGRAYGTAVDLFEDDVVDAVLEGAL